MNYQKLSTLTISLIGFYSIFSAIIISGMQVLILVMAPFQPNGWEMAGYTSMALIPQFLAPLIFGIVIIRKSAKISRWLLAKIEVEGEEKIEGIRFEDMSFLLFSLLGLYMISTTFPDALRLFAAWFSYLASSPGTLVYGDDGFWDGRFPEVAYHIAAMSFSVFVFSRGLSISRFVNACRKKGLSNQSAHTTPASAPR
ncbi:hypothetical protein [Pelagicoccus sp. SDUM812003]|uniref:hypothetical protein n=1 Tax=Pelagicoccus sp. SDUM812003 TaxID=3041267 RepID=UPI00280E198D|nr:hypothetical protein [Pelagicoccus sp. SDUM812003]MDQ8205811.1 hypothetical protein [Pelagicoccus sp. SDUM812003]